jgi:PilZ domain
VLRAATAVSERRRHPRLAGSFPTLVRSAEPHRRDQFRAEATIDNISAGGLYMRLARPVEPGVRLFIVVHFSDTNDPNLSAPRFTMRGVVQRVEPQPGGALGVAVRITRRRML